MPSKIPACLLALAWAFGNLPSATAQEIKWFTDYNLARQEASDKGKPLLIDFGTENCVWCKQLDLRTFKDAGVAGTLNDRFVAVKIDANRNRALTEALHIQSFPTLVFASSDGHILGYQEGFIEAPKMKDQLQRALAAVTAPEWMTRDFEEANKAFTEGRYSRALSLLQNIVEDGKERPIQNKARKMLRQVDELATNQLARARMLADKGMNNEASDAVTELIRTYSGTQAAREGNTLLTSINKRTENNDPLRVKRARDLLTQAKDDFRSQQFLCSLDRCELLIASYSELPEAGEANQLAADIKANSEWARQAADQMSDRLCILYLSLADNHLKRGQPQQAIYYLELVNKTAPSSRHAETATNRMAQLQGQPRGGGK